MHIEGVSLVETQNLASHEGGVHLLPAYYSLRMLVWDRTGDARFCVSTREECICCQRIIACVCWHGRDGRRKILRLYFGLTAYNRICLLLMIMVAEA